jgi:hypothetical protein
MAAEQISNGDSGLSARTKINKVLARGTAFEDWDPSGADYPIMPTDADEVGSGVDNAILKGDRVLFTVAGGTLVGELWPADTIGTAKQDSPTLLAHWRLI